MIPILRSLSLTWHFLAVTSQEIDELDPFVLSQPDYESVFLKFDPECIQNQDLDLVSHFQDVLSRIDTTNTRSFAATNAMPSGEEFAKLLDSSLDKVSFFIDVKHSDEKKKYRRKLREDYNLEFPSHRRALGSLSQEHRENQIFASLHLLAAATLVGIPNIDSVLEIESGESDKSLASVVMDNDKIGIDTRNIRAGNTYKHITSFQSLDYIEVKIVNNPVLLQHLLPLADKLPCLELQAESDVTRAMLGTRRQFELTSEPDGMNLTAAGGTNYDTTTNVSFIGPNDPMSDSQWYLKGKAQGENFGGDVIDAWAQIAQIVAPNSASPPSFNDMISHSKGMTVAVLDSGCSQSPDLVRKFWRNPQTSGCTANAIVGDGSNGTGSLKGDCIGYDFGNDNPDPTHEEEGTIHGSSSSGLIAADSQNNLGMSGICPLCDVMCLKISDTTRAKISLANVIRALDYVGRLGVKLSNHSYGGFGPSEIEKSAHIALGKLGHLSVCSSGNNGCNIDFESNDPGVCAGDTGPAPLFTPAGYDIDSIISVGATDKNGERAYFSNYGVQNVDLFAPGKEILTIYGESKMAYVQGTSFSGPIVAGMIAQLWATFPELTAAQVKKLFISTCTPVDSLADKSVCGGVLSLAAAVRAAMDKDAVLLGAVKENTHRSFLLAPLVALTLPIVL